MKSALTLALVCFVLLGTLTTSCKKEETPPTNLSSSNSLTDADYQFVGKFESDSVSLIYSYSSDLISFFTGGQRVDYTADSARWVFSTSFTNDNTKESILISKGGIEYLSSAQDFPSGEFEKYFSKGAHPYTADSALFDDGILISYTDKSGETWRSDFGPQPAGSSFVIEDTISSIDGAFKEIKIKALVNCTVFSADRSRSKKLINCTLITPFVIGW